MIVDTYLKYVNGKKTVIFCASVDHAAEIAKLLRDNGVKAEAVSGRDWVEIRDKILKDYETGSTNVLCACDLLNEGWDSPHTTVLFMARPTMSKTIYMQQLGRGTRRCPGKDDLLVIDFVDNANMFCPTVCIGCWIFQNISPWPMCWPRRTSGGWIRTCCSREKSRKRGWMCRLM